MKILLKEKSPFLDKLLVRAKDRKYQIWERNSLSIPLWSGKVIHQKLEFIHYNPVPQNCAIIPTNTNIRARDFTTGKIGNGNFWFIVTDSSTSFVDGTGMNVRRILMIQARVVVGEPTHLLSHNTNNGESIIVGIVE